MKKIIFVSPRSTYFNNISFCCSYFYYNRKVLKVFSDAFPEVKQPTWYNFDNYYEVYFTNADNSSCRIDYSPDGIVLSTTRYYTSQNLSPVIRAKVNEKYPGKKIFGITEVSNSDLLKFHIVLEDDKYWLNIQSDAMGNISPEKKLLAKRIIYSLQFFTTGCKIKSCNLFYLTSRRGGFTQSKVQIAIILSV